MVNRTSQDHFSYPLPAVKNSVSIPPKEITEITKNLTNINNLPIELKQKIAFNLNSQDYTNFRNTSKIMRTDLPSIRHIYSKINNKECSGDLKINYTAVINKPIEEDLFSGLWLG